MDSPRKKLELMGLYIVGTLLLGKHSFFYIIFDCFDNLPIGKYILFIHFFWGCWRCGYKTKTETKITMLIIASDFCGCYICYMAAIPDICCWYRVGIVYTTTSPWMTARRQKAQAAWLYYSSAPWSHPRWHDQCQMAGQILTAVSLIHWANQVYVYCKLASLQKIKPNWSVFLAPGHCVLLSLH